MTNQSKEYFGGIFRVEKVDCETCSETYAVYYRNYEPRIGHLYAQNWLLFIPCTKTWKFKDGRGAISDDRDYDVTRVLANLLDQAITGKLREGAEIERPA